MDYLFYFCDPVASFGTGSMGARSRKIFGAWGESKLGSDVWQLGQRAYEIVSAAIGHEVSIEDLKIFIASTHQPVKDMWLSIEEGVHNGNVVLIDAATGEPGIAHLDWKDASWQWQMRFQIHALIEIGRANGSPFPVESLATHIAVVVLCELDSAVVRSLDDDSAGVVESILNASWLLNQVDGTRRIEEEAATKLKQLDSQRASERAKQAHANHPRRRARNFVYECWLQWEAKPNQYPSAAAFARAMLDKEPATLTSEVVVTRWVREWRRARPSTPSAE